MYSQGGKSDFDHAVERQVHSEEASNFDVSIFGWGKQSEERNAPMATELVQLKTETTTCLVHAHAPVETRYYSWLMNRWFNTRNRLTSAPQFLCLDAIPTVGAPCAGDDGGEFRSPLLQMSSR